MSEPWPVIRRRHQAESSYAHFVPIGNTLYYGDNLDVLRKHITSEPVDLIYLDPPFNSNRIAEVAALPVVPPAPGAGQRRRPAPRDRRNHSTTRIT
jgi:hypothetical protein